MVERCRNSQVGGIPRRSAETGSHVARLFAERQRECKASYALVFVDAVAAFYSVVRDALWGPSRTLRCTRELFEEFGLDPALCEELWHQLQTEPAGAEVIGIRQFMADWCACTWVDVRGCELKAETSRGVVPVNPMADLLFNAVMVRVLEEIHRCSEEMAGSVMVPLAVGLNVGDVLRVFDCDDVVPVSDVTYVDDFCLMVSAEKPGELIERTAEMIRVCRRALAKHGLKMILSKGKTECTTRHIGRGSQELVAGPVLTVDDAVVRVVRSYKHLGTIHTATGNMMEEDTARVRAMMVVYLALAGRVFGSPKLSLWTKLRLADTLLWFILLFATGPWSAFMPTVLRCFNTACMRVLRKCAGRCRGAGDRGSVRNCKYQAYRRCCAVSNCNTWREPPERV